MFAIPDNFLPLLPEFPPVNYHLSHFLLESAYTQYYQNLLISESLNAQLALYSYLQDPYTNQPSMLDLAYNESLAQLESLEHLEQLYKKQKRDDSFEMITQISNYEDPDVSTVQFRSRKNSRDEILSYVSSPKKMSNKDIKDHKELISLKANDMMKKRKGQKSLEFSPIRLDSSRTSRKKESSGKNKHNHKDKSKKKLMKNPFRDMGNIIELPLNEHDVIIPFLNPEYTSTVEDVLSPLPKEIGTSTFNRLFNDEVRSKIGLLSKALNKELCSLDMLHKGNLPQHTNMEIEKERTLLEKPISSLKNRNFESSRIIVKVEEKERREHKEHPHKLSIIPDLAHSHHHHHNHSSHHSHHTNSEESLHVKPNSINNFPDSDKVSATTASDQFDSETSSEEGDILYQGESVITSVGSQYQARIPQLNKKKNDLLAGKRRNLKMQWSPEFSQSVSLEETIREVSKVLGQDVGDEAKVINLLKKFSMDKGEVVRELERAKPFYLNYFRPGGRQLRYKASPSAVGSCK